MTVMLAVLAQRLDFAVPDGVAPMPRARLSVRPRGGMPLLVTPR
jgi:cytochrome P450